MAFRNFEFRCEVLGLPSLGLPFAQVCRLNKNKKFLAFVSAFLIIIITTSTTTTTTTTLLATRFYVAIPFLLHETTKINANCFDVIFLSSCYYQAQQIATGLKHCSIIMEVVHTLLLLCNVKGLHLTEQ